MGQFGMMEVSIEVYSLMPHVLIFTLILYHSGIELPKCLCLFCNVISATRVGRMTIFSRSLNEKIRGGEGGEENTLEGTCSPFFLVSGFVCGFLLLLLLLVELRVNQESVSFNVMYSERRRRDEVAAGFRKLKNVLNVANNLPKCLSQYKILSKVSNSTSHLSQHDLLCQMPVVSFLLVVVKCTIVSGNSC